MASTRDIRRRIKSVKNTRQITKAMELVAASKMKKAQQAALAGRGYAGLMAEMLAAVAGRVEEGQHPFLARRDVKVRGIILVTSDKGLEFIIRRPQRRSGERNVLGLDGLERQRASKDGDGCIRRRNPVRD